MSLIYSALSRLERKSSISSTSSKPHLSAEYYSLSMQNRGMPLWIKVMLILVTLGIILGFILAKSLPRFSAEKSAISEGVNEARSVVAVASSNPVTPVELVAAPEALAVTEMISSPKFAEAKHEDARVALEERAAPRVDTQALPVHSKAVIESKIEPKLSGHDTQVSSDVGIAKNNEVAPQNEALKSELSKPKTRPELVSKIEFKVESKVESKIESKVENKNKALAVEKTSLSANSKSKGVESSSSKKQNNRTVENKEMAGLSQEEIQGMVKSFKSLIQAGKRAEANEILEVMKKNLAPESLTLLNLRAWGELKMGDQNVALTLYQQIVERSPDDESAAINLAVLYWKKGMQAEAKKTIEAISEVYPNSNVVQQYSRQFGVQR